MPTILIIGKRGSGKTTLAAELMKQSKGCLLFDDVDFDMSNPQMQKLLLHCLVNTKTDVIVTTQYEESLSKNFRDTFDEIRRLY